MIENFRNKLLEFTEQFKPRYVLDFEIEANKWMSGLTLGATKEFLLKAEDKGLILYHHGPEVRVIPSINFAREESTGNEYVFFEYLHCGAAYHLVGSVDTNKQFTFKELDRSQGKEYHRISPRKHRDILTQVTQILREIQPPEFRE